MSIGAIGSSSCQGPSQAWKDKIFKTADTDGDGKLSADEFSALTKKMESRRGPPPPDSSDASATDATAKPDAATLFKSFDTDGDGSLSETELDTGMQSLHQAMADAVKKHKSGDSESLTDMLFGKPTDDGVTDSTSTTGVDGTSSSTSSSSTDDASSDASKTSSFSTDTMRLQQWMLDAFSSQFNVSNSFAQAA